MDPQELVIDEIDDVQIVESDEKDRRMLILDSFIKSNVYDLMDVLREYYMLVDQK